MALYKSPVIGEREDLLSVLRDLRPYYFSLLVAQLAVWVVVVFLSERSGCIDEDIAGCAVTIGLKMSGLVPLSLITSVIFVDAGRYLMVLLRNSRERLITRAKMEANAEGRAEGKVEGRAEGRAEGKVEGRAEGRAEGKVEGKAEGANEMHDKWSAWNVRRIEHERRGEPFDVPPPSPEDCGR